MLVLLVCPVSPAAQTSVLNTGDTVPDCEFVDQNGKAVHLSQFKGKALAITFIFTRCPLADYCPRMTGRFAESQRGLVAEKNWHLLSLSFDPAYDTPEKLLAYAKIHNADLTHWTFATAAGNAVRDFGALFGLTSGFKNGLLDHNLRTVVIDAEGRVQHVFQGNAWTAQELAWEMKKAMPLK